MPHSTRRSAAYKQYSYDAVHEQVLPSRVSRTDACVQCAWHGVSTVLVGSTTRAGGHVKVQWVARYKAP